MLLEMHKSKGAAAASLFSSRTGNLWPDRHVVICLEARIERELVFAGGANRRARHVRDVVPTVPLCISASDVRIVCPVSRDPTIDKRRTVGLSVAESVSSR